MEAIFAIFGILVICLILLAIAIAPSVVNILLSFLVYLTFNKLSKSKLISIIPAVTASILLTFNVRSVDLLIDVFSKSEKIEINHPITISNGESISIESNTEKISYRENIFSVNTIGAGSACSCLYQANPKINEENVRNSISRLSIAIAEKNTSTYHLIVNAGYENGIENIYFEIYKGNSILVRRDLQKRVWYKDENFLSQKKQHSASSIVTFLLGDTFWRNLFAHIYPNTPTDGLIYNELKSILKIQNKQVTLKTAEAILITDAEIDRTRLMDIGASGKQIGCDAKEISVSRSDWQKYTLNIGERSFPIDIGNFYESLICLDRSIYIVSTPSEYEALFKVTEFDQKGSHMASAEYHIARTQWKGFPRKPLVYVEKHEDSLVLGIKDISHDKTINDLYIYKLKTPSLL